MQNERTNEDLKNKARATKIGVTTTLRVPILIYPDSYVSQFPDSEFSQIGFFTTNFPKTNYPKYESSFFTKNVSETNIIETYFPKSKRIFPKRIE